MPRPRLSIEAQLALLATGLIALATLVALFIQRRIGDGPLSALFTFALLVPVSLWVASRWARPVSRLMRAVGDAALSFQDGDFSMSIGTRRRDELGDLVDQVNQVGDVLRRERQGVFQRELLLDTVIQSSPLALVLTDSAGHVIYSNVVARQMFLDGRKLEGCTFSRLLESSPAILREAVEGGRDTLFYLEPRDGEQEVVHLSQRHFLLNGRDHRLYLFKRLTRELTRQEVATWKKVIRVISHELNNSLAPISSLAHSGRLLAQDPDPVRLDKAFRTIAERAEHLKTFLEGYARFAKLPAPRPEPVSWPEFVSSLRRAVPFREPDPLPAEDGWFDAAQLEQVVINLVRNAQEAASRPEDIELSVTHDARTMRLQVLDRGTGMSGTVLQNALLPFYSTKRTGSGLGLSLSREIAEAHGGGLSLMNRPGGGMAVTVWLPRRPADIGDGHPVDAGAQ
jgi:nitrogen fixation/metabolism regulation signal transduction histidine kinase